MTGRRAFTRGIAGAAVVSLLVAITGCAAGTPEVVPSDDDVDAAVTVTVTDNRYEPAEVEIAVGDAVTWEFAGGMEHDVVADDGSFVSELTRSGTYTHVFTAAGEYGYDCSVHPEMTGVVRVSE